MSEVTTILWWEQNRWLALAVSSSVALHSAVLALAPGPAESKALAPLVVRIDAMPAPVPHLPVHVASAARPAPSPHPALRVVRAAAPVQHMQPPATPPTQATAALAVDVEEKPVAEPAAQPAETQVALVAATPAAPPAQTTASANQAASPPEEKLAALDKPPAAGPSSSDETATSPVGYLYNPAPRYPLEARQLRLEGEVLLHVRVDSTGTAREATIAKSSGVALLDEAALTGVRAWRFSPAKHGGTPIEHWVAVPIQFKLEQRAHVD